MSDQIIGTDTAKADFDPWVHILVEGDEEVNAPKIIRNGTVPPHFEKEKDESPGGEHKKGSEKQS